MPRKSNKPPIRDKTCFVLMPFHSSFDAIYENAICEAIEPIPHLSCVRADDIYGPRPIMVDVWRSIQNADIVVADLTGKNPNVLYELGLAHAVQKPVILIAQSMEDIPFDLRAIRSLIYHGDRESREVLKGQLTKAVSEYLRDAETASPELLAQYVVLQVTAKVAAERGRDMRETDQSGSPQLASADPMEQLHALSDLSDQAGESYSYKADPADVAAVVDCLESPHGEVRLAAIECLGKLKSKVHAYLLHGFAEDPNPAIQEAAVRSIGASYDQNAEELLLELFDDKPAFGVRKAIVDVLGRIGTEMSVSRYGQILTDTNATGREIREAVKVLCRLERYGGLVTVLNVDLDKLDTATKRELTESLAELEFPSGSTHCRIEKMLRTLMEDASVDVRGGALAAWCLNSSDEWEGFLDRDEFWQQLFAASEDVVKAFFQAVGLYRPFVVEDGPKLIELQTKYPFAADEVVSALYDTAGLEVAGFMKQFLDPDSSHRQSAFVYFARNPSPEVTEDCRQEMREGTVNTPLLAAVCLARLGDGEAVEFVKDQVKKDMAYPWAKKYALPVLETELVSATGAHKRTLNRLINSIR